MVVAPPAHITARSARIHSTLVPAAMPTRCSGSSPRESSPAASFSTFSPVCVHVHDSQGWSSPTGKRYASVSGDFCTRSRNCAATFGARFSMKEVSVLTGDMRLSWAGIRRGCVPVT